MNIRGFLPQKKSMQGSTYFSTFCYACSIALPLAQVFFLENWCIFHTQLQSGSLHPADSLGKLKQLPNHSQSQPIFLFLCTQSHLDKIQSSTEACTTPFLIMHTLLIRKVSLASEEKTTTTPENTRKYPPSLPHMKSSLIPRSSIKDSWLSVSADNKFAPEL